MRTRLVYVALFASLLSAGCGDDSFKVQRAPEFPMMPGAHVSVFGVYKDGRLAPEAWDALRVHLAPLFGAPACEPGYPDIVSSSGTPVLQAVDDYSRANGVTDELLDRLSTAAKGDLVLLVTETGRAGAKVADTSDAPGANAGAGPASLRTGGRHGGATPAQSRKPVAEANTFEVVGLLFSTHAHKTVGVVRLTYTGASFDDAMQSFFGRLGSELPGATCEGWRPDLKLDAAEIRKLDTE
jgi:hypothetical protein